MKDHFFRERFSQNKQETTIALSSVIAIALVFFYPSQSPLESLWLSFFLLFLFPLLTVKYIFRKKLTSIGLKKGRVFGGFSRFALFLAGFTILFFLALKNGYLAGAMRLPAGVSRSLWGFLAFQFFLALPIHFFWEFFFRGYLQLGLAPKIGGWAIFLSAIFQLAISGKTSTEIAVFYFISLIAAGIIAQKSKSIHYSFLFLWLLSAIADIIVIRASLAG